MGCDIHLYAEKRQEGKWVTADKWTDNPDYPEDSKNPKQVDGGWRGNTNDRFYTDGRNYNLFSALAGVRNYIFDGEPPMVSPPKGLPEDCCEEIKLEREGWGSDGHSDSYLTLKELEAFDWSSYGATCDDFRKEVIPKMKLLADNLEDVRIVFWFDN